MNISQLIQIVVELTPYAQVNVTSPTWDSENILSIQHSVWNEQSYYRLAGKSFPLQLVPLLNVHLVHQSILQILTNYGIIEEQELEVDLVHASDVAFEYKSTADGIARLGLIRLVNQQMGHVEIPEINSGGAFNLGMIGLDFNTFYFGTMTLIDNVLTFSGSNEDDDAVEIDENDLPDNGLSYLLDYLLTGTY